MQDGAPGLAANAPAAQTNAVGEKVGAAGGGVGDKVGASVGAAVETMQIEAPWLLYEPNEHAVHAEDPDAAEYVLAGQIVGDVAPVEEK